MLPQHQHSKGYHIESHAKLTNGVTIRICVMRLSLVYFPHYSVP